MQQHILEQVPAILFGMGVSRADAMKGALMPLDQFQKLPAFCLACLHGCMNGFQSSLLPTALKNYIRFCTPAQAPVGGWDGNQLNNAPSRGTARTEALLRSANPG